MACTLPYGDRPLCEVSGPQGGLVATAVPCGGVPSLAPVVMVQEAAHDDATVAFLLAQALVAEQEAEEKAREAKELERFQEELAKRERVLLDEVESRRGSSDFSPLEYAAIRWAVYKQRGGFEDEEKEEEEEEAQEAEAANDEAEDDVVFGVWVLPDELRLSCLCASGRTIGIVGTVVCPRQLTEAPWIPRFTVSSSADHVRDVQGSRHVRGDSSCLSLSVCDTRRAL